MSDNGRTLVIGCGNLLGADDGVGLVALERLRALDPPPELELVDGGTWGLNLLPLIEDATRVLFIDAVHAGLEPGSIVVLEREQIPRYFGFKLSPHQVDLREVLALAEFRGRLPADTVVVGMQPERVEMSTELSVSVAGRVDDLVNAVADRLARWGFAVGREVEPAGA